MEEAVTDAIYGFLKQYVFSQKEDADTLSSDEKEQMEQVLESVNKMFEKPLTPSSFAALWPHSENLIQDSLSLLDKIGPSAGIDKRTIRNMSETFTNILKVTETMTAANTSHPGTSKQQTTSDVISHSSESESMREIIMVTREKILRNIICEQMRSLLQPSLKIHVKSSADLLLRTSINRPGLLLEFFCTESFKGFEGTIRINFPPFSVLGEEKISVEIFAEDVIVAYNERSRKHNIKAPEIICPIVNIDRETDTAFLRNVEISLPVLARTCYSSKLESFSCPDKNIWISNGAIHLFESKFSPKSACVEKGNMLKALRVDMHYSLVFRELGVYFLCQQLPNLEFVLDLRRFTDEEEHRSYRMDETKSLRMIVNPQIADAAFAGSAVTAIFEDPVEVMNTGKFRNVSGNSIRFKYPNVNFEADNSNERKVTLQVNDGLASTFGVLLDFENESLRKTGIDGVLQFPIHSESVLEKLTTRQVLPKQEMLVEFLVSLKTNWIKFMYLCLNAEVRFLKELIHKDIKESLLPRKLIWSKNIQSSLKDETDMRGLTEISSKEKLVSTMINIYQTSHELMIAKEDILEMLENAGVLSRSPQVSRSLLPKNCEVLAAALMYLPITQLREAMRKAFEKRLFCPRDDVERFIYSGDLPEGETSGNQEAGRVDGDD